MKIRLAIRSVTPDTATEPRLSDQWFLKMESLAEPALKAVDEGVIKFVPDKFKTTYDRWLTDIRDWCISRQLWWGTAYLHGISPTGRLS